MKIRSWDGNTQMSVHKYRTEFLLFLPLFFSGLKKMITLCNDMPKNDFKKLKVRIKVN